MKLILCALLFVALASSSFASEPLERDASSVNCFAEVEMCTYVSQNIEASLLFTKINQIMFPGGALLPEDGYIFVDSKVIRFWLNDESKQQRFTTLLPMLDTFEEFTAVPLVNFTTEVYSVTERGYTHLQVSAENFAQSAFNATEGEGLVSGAFKIRLNIKDTDLASIFGAQLMKEESMKVATINQAVANGGTMNFSQLETIPFSPTPGVAKEAQVGITTTGQISISKDNPDLVQIENYTIAFAVDDPTATSLSHVRVSTLNISADAVHLLRNQSRLMISTNIIEDNSSSGVGFTLTGRNRTKTYTKLVIVVKAEGYSHEDYIRGTNDETSPTTQFTQEEVENFPEDTISMDEIAKSIKTHTSFTLSGDRVLGFYLDPKLARTSNYKKNIVVQVKGGGINTQDVKTVEDLMLNGYSFTGLDPFKMGNSEMIKIQVLLSEPKYEATSWKRWQKKITLYYFPSSNRFSERIDMK